MKLWSIVVFLFLFSFISVNAIPTVEIGNIDNNLPIVQMGNGKSICPDGFVAQNLTKSNKLECVNASMVLNVSQINFSGANFTANLEGYATLNGSVFTDEGNSTLDTKQRIMYDSEGNYICTWHTDAVDGLQCQDIYQGVYRVCDESGNCNSTYNTYNDTLQSVTDRGNWTNNPITINNSLTLLSNNSLRNLIIKAVNTTSTAGVIYLNSSDTTTISIYPGSGITTSNITSKFQVITQDRNSSGNTGTSILLQGGSNVGTGSGSGGAIQISSGAVTAGTGSGGTLNIFSGSSYNGTGGEYRLEAGKSRATRPGQKGGNFYIQGGLGENNASGGFLYLAGGNSGVYPGNVQILGGKNLSNNVYSSVYVKQLNLDAGTSLVDGASLKFNSGNLLTTPEIGAMEFLTDKLYFTRSTGTKRLEVLFNESSSNFNTSGNITANVINATGNISMNGNVFTIDADGNPMRLGFGAGGTTYAGMWLGSAAPTFSNYAFLSDGGTNSFFNAPTSLYFRLGNGDKMRLTSTGFGIGTTNPLTTLDINGTSRLFINTSATEPQLQSSSTGIQLVANNQGIFRGLDAWVGTWADGVNTTYFQTGRNSGNTIFTARQGTSFNRLSYYADKITYLGSSGANRVPISYFEVRSNLAGYTNHTIFGINNTGATYINNTASTVVPLTIFMNKTQTANAFEIKNSSGSLLFNINATGKAYRLNNEICDASNNCQYLNASNLTVLNDTLQSVTSRGNWTNNSVNINNSLNIYGNEKINNLTIKILSSTTSDAGIVYFNSSNNTDIYFIAGGGEITTTGYPARIYFKSQDSNIDDDIQDSMIFNGSSNFNTDGEGTAGGMKFYGGDSQVGSGGTITFKAGYTNSTAIGKTGGHFIMNGGNSYSIRSGGRVDIQGGTGYNNLGGAVSISGGYSNFTGKSGTEYSQVNIKKLLLTAGTSINYPFKFTSGTLLTTPQAGAMEFLTDKLYFTRSTGTKRLEILFNESSSNFNTSGNVTANVINATIYYGNGSQLTGIPMTTLNDTLQSVTDRGATTTNSITAGSSYQAIIGDDGNSKSGYFTDGTNIVTLADGAWAGTFNDGTNNYYIGGGYAFTDNANWYIDSNGYFQFPMYNGVMSSGGSYGTGGLYASGADSTSSLYWEGEIGGTNGAGYFTDYTNSVVLADGTNAITTTGNVDITGNLNQTSGNATINNIYGEMYCKNDTGCGTVDLVTTDVYVAMRNQTAGNNNGFTLNGGTNLTAQVSGIYKAEAKVSITGGVPAGEYGMKIYVNDTGQNNCYDHFHVGADQISMVITCLVRVNAGSNISIKFDDHASPVTDLTVYASNLNLVRIGN
jgi:hypothetical protein